MKPARARTFPAFEILVNGHLDPDWSDWLDGFEMRLLPNGQTRFSGRASDQAALIGLLNRLADLNLTLVSVRSVRGGCKRNPSHAYPDSFESIGEKNGKQERS